MSWKDREIKSNLMSLLIIETNKWSMKVKIPYAFYFKITPTCETSINMNNEYQLNNL